MDYPRYHQERINLAIHLIAVPMFVAGAVATVGQLLAMHWAAAGLAALVPPIAFAAQGLGHRREPEPPLPFAGPGDVVTRILLEQFWRFPRFVLTGGWWAAWTASR